MCCTLPTSLGGPKSTLAIWRRSTTRPAKPSWRGYAPSMRPGSLSLRVHFRSVMPRLSGSTCRGSSASEVGLLRQAPAAEARRCSDERRLRSSSRSWAEQLTTRRWDRDEHGTSFLNVDLDIYSRTRLEPLVSALGKNVFVLHVGWEGGRHGAHLEVSGRSDLGADRLIRYF